MENLPANFKKLKINHGAVRRLFKELCYYEKEEVELQGKLNNLKDKDGSGAHISRAEEIWQETVRVLPHINMSLRKSINKLIEIVTVNFMDILQISDKKILFCKNYYEDVLKEKHTSLYEDLYKEIDDINHTLENIFLHVKDVTISSCNSEVKDETIVISKEECIDI
ncbi:tubulin-specific chaperone a, putative [Plasmodium ovale wallikeri]|uniref:Tubulin-specific chaperone A n=2 Tax=Plasmodium ovale TaxID=36330 RepID=A0A1A8YGE9_PLAOA|nr:tubulin-specific chaperone a, putative [Plasmodium ovale wallikeri]SBT31240.1 tubulin-specific chaperone a, putative [Plasmodium ovale wallikeri]SBT75282.1 tubulin-specific chaperone a, putative [Plasmodium ovale]